MIAQVTDTDQLAILLTPASILLLQGFQTIHNCYCRKGVMSAARFAAYFKFAFCSQRDPGWTKVPGEGEITRYKGSDDEIFPSSKLLGPLVNPLHCKTLHTREYLSLALADFHAVFFMFVTLIFVMRYKYQRIEIRVS